MIIPVTNYSYPHLADSVYFNHSYRFYKIFLKCGMMNSSSNTPNDIFPNDALSKLTTKQKYMLGLLIDAYPALANPKNTECFEILKNAEFLRRPDKTILAEAGTECNRFIFLLKGYIRVYQISEEGREVTLYRIKPGDICIMSLNSMLNGSEFKAHNQCDSDVEIMTISKRDFFRAMNVSETFCHMILSSLTRSFCDITDTFYGIAFGRVEFRLACLLGRLAERFNSNTLKITHDEIANEIGTSREVVSRILKRLEQNQFVTLMRGSIVINKELNIHEMDLRE